MFQSQEFGFIEASTSALVGPGGVTEAVANHPLATGQGGLDNAGNMLAAGGEHEQGFCFQMHRLIQEQFAQFFAQRCASGFASDLYGQTTLAQSVGQPIDVTAFAGAIDAFKSDEFTSHGLPRW